MRTLLILTLTGLTLAGTARATTTSRVWFATKKVIARELTYNWTTSDDVRVRLSRCQGMGPAIHNSRGIPMWHRFACAELDYLKRIIYVRVVVTGPNVGQEKVTEVRCDNSNSDYECP
jgi:hypothetical protein